MEPLHRDPEIPAGGVALACRENSDDANMPADLPSCKPSTTCIGDSD
jgi:hypothetical protein